MITYRWLRTPSNCCRLQAESETGGVTVKEEEEVRLESGVREVTDLGLEKKKKALKRRICLCSLIF